jgi:lysozyme
MKISDKGLNIIKEFEGYGRELPNGDCTAYQEHLGAGKYDIPTIGWGCTEGVTMGLVWTRAQAEEALRREITKFEDGVTSLVRFIPTQNQFDALVSFSYNVGLGALAKSSVLRLANAGDYHGAADAFSMWTKAQGQTLAGLVRRRHEEAALFLEPSTDEAPLAMAQKVDEPVEGWSPTTTSIMNNTQSSVAAGGIGVGALHYFGLDPYGAITLVKQYGIELAIIGCVLIFVITEAFKHFKGGNQ